MLKKKNPKGGLHHNASTLFAGAITLDAAVPPPAHSTLAPAGLVTPAPTPPHTPLTSSGNLPGLESGFRPSVSMGQIPFGKLHNNVNMADGSDTSTIGTSNINGNNWEVLKKKKKGKLPDFTKKKDTGSGEGNLGGSNVPTNTSASSIAVNGFINLHDD
ncbi:hypothetical protein QCA50_018405 [Cerrena zonata]|uniref:Uncharacterized protein n=1 Tax=Cerrena zonata TaxID=2478898 RepID=A0AAW0FB01_9APHY